MTAADLWEGDYFMRTFNVTPGTFQDALNASVAGDVIRLGSGPYDKVYTLDRRGGRDGAPIIIEADPALPEGTIKISMDRDAEWYRPQANQIARERLENGKYPGMWDEAHKARLKISGCSHVIVRNLGFEKSWPTHIDIAQSTDVTIQDCHFLDGTFCIVAHGQNTQDITVDGCTWMQDRVPPPIPGVQAARMLQKWAWLPALIQSRSWIRMAVVQQPPQ